MLTNNFLDTLEMILINCIKVEFSLYIMLFNNGYAGSSCPGKTTFCVSNLTAASFRLNKNKPEKL